MAGAFLLGGFVGSDLGAGIRHPLVRLVSREVGVWRMSSFMSGNGITRSCLSLSAVSFFSKNRMPSFLEYWACDETWER